MVQSVYVFGYRWVGNRPTRPAGPSTGGPGALTLLARRGRVGKDGQLFRLADLLSESLDLTLDVTDTSLGDDQLGPELLGLPPQAPGARSEVGTRNEKETRPDQQPPHEAGPYPLDDVGAADAA